MLIYEIEFSVLVGLLPKGKENAIHQKDLADLLNVKPHIVKYYVHKARREGYEICSGKNGYYLPVNDDERREFYNMMKKSALSHFVSAKPVKHTLDTSSDQLSLTDLLNGTEDNDNGKQT